MDVHSGDWSALTDRITENYGIAYDPARRKELRPKLVRLLTREITNVDRELVVKALDDVMRRTKVTLDWHRFLCIILSSLPGWWVRLANNPGFGASTMLLLTDGTVMCQQEGGLNWKRLTPDASGSYVNGAWNDLAPMHWTRRYYASAVLNDGRVFVCGGEYSNAGGWTDKTEIYDPITDVWTEVAPPPAWGGVGDAPCAVLPDGRVLVGHFGSTKTALYDPDTDTWTAGPLKGSSSSEESWVLLPDDTVITVRCNSSKRADKYDAASNAWVSGGTLPVNIIEISSSEIGAGVLLPNGHAFFAGATNHTALYAPPVIASDPGTWTAGPDFPNDPSGQSVGCKDTPSCLLTNGRVLIAAGPVDGTNWLTPTLFQLFDGASIIRISDPPNATGVPYIGRLLMVPTGQVLFAAQTNAIYAYTYFSCPDPDWRPQITSSPSSVFAGFSYSLSGHRFNGMSQAVGYGDDASAATNYPLVRIRHLATGNVRYCRTFGHSTMGVATGSAPVSTNFQVPIDIDTGPSELCVVANGISSPCVPIGVHSLHFVDVRDWAVWARLIGSLADGDLWVLGPNGPIPVDPWGPKVVREARAARTKVLAGLKTLQELGEDVFAERKKAALEVEVAPDEGSPEGEEMEEEARERLKRFGTK
jgi:Kelch motif